VCALGDAQAWLAANEHRTKGEFVLVVEGVAAPAAETTDVENTLKALLEALPLKQAGKVLKVKLEKSPTVTFHILRFTDYHST
jgi:16S rRNA C1402 (ribose-2'-O) methylase RsmI